MCALCVHHAECIRLFPHRLLRWHMICLFSDAFSANWPLSAICMRVSKWPRQYADDEWVLVSLSISRLRLAIQNRSYFDRMPLKWISIVGHPVESMYSSVVSTDWCRKYVLHHTTIDFANLPTIHFQYTWANSEHLHHNLLSEWLWKKCLHHRIKYNMNVKHACIRSVVAMTTKSFDTLLAYIFYT